MTEAAEAATTQLYKVSAFPAVTAAPSYPLVVRAPVVVDARTQEGCQPLLDYLAGLTSHDNIKVAEAEGQRLMPYFSALNVYLSHVLEKQADGPERETLKKLSTPGNLAKIFNALAGYARATMISDVVVMPDNIRHVGPAKELFRRWDEFNASYDYKGRLFNFGFLQAFDSGNRKNATNSTTFPVMLVDTDMIDALPAEVKEPVIRDFQSVMTLVNHDMLHHFSVTVIGSNTVFKTQERQEFSYTDPLKEWKSTLPYREDADIYEDWAQMGQEKVILAPGNEAMVEEARRAVDHFMDGLASARDVLLRTSDGSPPSAEQLARAHEVVDYFGTVMAHALTRGFPLNHPVMQHCLDRMENLDPAPKEALRDCVDTMSFPPMPKDNRPDEAELLSELRRAWGMRIGSTTSVIKGYREAGFEVCPPDNKDLGYRHFKMLELIRLGGLDSHTPVIDDRPLTQVRTNMDNLTAKMVQAAAKTAGFEPG